MTQLGDGDERVAIPAAWFDSLAVHPAGSLSIPHHLEIVAEILGSDGASLVEQHRNLAQYQGVALDGSGVVGLEVPDVVPDGLGLGPPWETSEALELGDGRQRIAGTRSPGWDDLAALLLHPANRT